MFHSWCDLGENNPFHKFVDEAEQGYRLVALWIILVFFGLENSHDFGPFPDCWMVDVLRQSERNILSHSVVFGPIYFRNSGWI